MKYPGSSVRILVCGGRSFSDSFIVSSTLNVLTHGYDNITIIHGGATGADELADVWASRRGATVEKYPADWSLGKAAGPIRNRLMLREGDPSIVVAFAGGRGTEDMVKQATKKNYGMHILVLRVQCCPAGVTGGCPHQRPKPIRIEEDHG